MACFIFSKLPHQCLGRFRPDSKRNLRDKRESISSVEQVSDWLKAQRVHWPDELLIRRKGRNPKGVGDVLGAGMDGPVCFAMKVFYTFQTALD